MFNALLALRLQTGPLPGVLYALSVVVLVVLATKRPMRTWLPVQLAGALIGVGIGYLLAWLISDVWDSFGVSLTPMTRLWFGLGIGAIGFAIAGLRRSRPRRMVLAISSVFLFALAGGVGINVDVAEFPTLGSALGVSSIRALALPVADPMPSPTSAVVRTIAESWHAPADLPRAGTVGSVVIPATISHFAARTAIVYLPPAALVKNAPRLPVLEMLSGQPGSPSNLISAGALATILDGYAAEHAGLAPIVVIPDQLGAPQSNPMCIDSPLGNSATYLTVDVPNWINSHLHVLGERADWAIGGFSQGGTCSIQIGARFTGIYGTIFDISGQLAPYRVSVRTTIATGFGGSVAAYDAAKPLALLAAHGPYTDTLGIFVVGQNDARYSATSVTVSNAARAAGMTVDHIQSPGTAHDWHTVQFAIRRALPLLYARWGLS